MPADHGNDRGVSPGVLVAALAWRARREGLGYLVLGLVPFAVAAGFSVLATTILGGGVNDAGTFARFASSYGAHADRVGLGVALLLLPGLVAICAAIAVGLAVRNLVGSEASRGGIEALLACPYRPNDIMISLLGYLGALATCYWAAMSTLGAVVVLTVTWTSGATLSLPAAYLLLALALPLLGAWCATSLSLLINLLYPRLAQLGTYGLNMSGGSLAGSAALLPALGVFVVFVFLGPDVGPAALLVIGGGTTAAVAAVSTLVVARRFRPDAVLES
jgi:hypothetical protein